VRALFARSSLVLLLLVGCKPVPGPGEADAGAESDAGGPDDAGAPLPTATAVIGPEGGTVKMEGVTIAVPPGAVDGTHDFRIVRTRERSDDPKDHSPEFRLEPHGVTFKQPVSLTLDVVGELDDLVLWRQQEPGTAPERIPFTRDGNRISATLDHFCWVWVGIWYWDDHYCPLGRVWDGRSCVDLNECLWGGCDYRTTCTNTVGSYTCGPCPAGFGGTGYTYCYAVCAAGTWDHDGYSGSACVPHRNCAAGSFASSAGTATADRQCTACPSGTFSTATNASSCTPFTACQPGQQIAFAGSSTQDRQCTACASGQFSATSNALTCASWRDCAAGTHVAATGTASADRRCDVCPTGTFSTQTNQPSCAAKRECPAGQFISSAGSTIEDRQCSACAEGTFASGVNLASCSQWSSCVAGQQILSEGSVTTNRACTPCAAGAFSTTANASSCDAWRDCPVGTSVSVSGSSQQDRTCTACTAGTFTSQPNQSTCQPQQACPAGKVQTAAGTLSSPPTCEACPVGTHCPGGELPQVSCGGTTWDDDANPATPCISRSDCGPGTFLALESTATSDRLCSPCAADSFSTGTNATECTAWTECGAGLHVDVAGTASGDRTCAPCASGTFSLGPNDASCAAWRDCQPGTFVSNTPSATEDRLCKPCTGGTYSTQVNQSACLPQGVCHAGSFTSSPGTQTSPTVCEPCNSGTYCAGGSAPKEPCAQGKWDHDLDPASLCADKTKCSAGTYVLDEGTGRTDRTCAGCSGSFSTEENAPSCTPWTTCGVGSFVQTPGSPTTNPQCAGCGSGTFTDAPNASLCAPWSDCAAGTYVEAAGSASANRTCTVCPSNSYTSVPNQSQCTSWNSCAAGTEQLASGSTTTPVTCGPCAAGSFCPGGSTPRVECGGSSWDHDSNPATACAPKTTCLAGQRMDSAGSATADRTCVTCGPETFNTTENSQFCVAWTTCSAGSYVTGVPSATSNRSCTTCPSGQFSSAENASACTAWKSCPAGTRISSAGTSQSDRVCTACASGSFTLSADQSSCTLWTTCGPGLVEATPGSSTQDRLCGPIGWTRQWTSANLYTDETHAIAVDAAANVYAAGITDGALGGPSAGGRDAWVKKLNGDGVEQWVRQYGTAGEDTAEGVAVDSAGNVYVAGWTQGNLGGTSAGSMDIYLRKLDASGAVLWTRQVGNSSFEVAHGVAVDSAGNVLVLGFTNGTLGAASVGGTDLVVLKYTPAGSLLWTQQLGTAVGDSDVEVAVGPLDAIYALGHTTGAIEGTSAGSTDVFVRKLNADGSTAWTQQWGSAGNDYPTSLDVDASGNVYIAGSTAGALNGPNAGKDDAFLTRLDPAGNVAWSRQWGTASNEVAMVSVSPAGAIQVGGSCVGAGANSGDWDLYLRTFLSDGSVVKTLQWGSVGGDVAHAITTDSAGLVYLGGTTSGNLSGSAAGGSFDAFAIQRSAE
jgi:hypothetical protein